MANAPATPIRRAPSFGSGRCGRGVGGWRAARLALGHQLHREGVPEESPEFARAINEGQTRGVCGKRHDRAADFYRQAVETARHDTERASARLGLARTRLRAGQRTAAMAAYRDVLKLPSTVTDGNGLSYWSSAAAPLVELGAGLDVLARVNGDLESPAVWPPVQMYRFRTILEALRGSRDQAVERGAGVALERLGARLVHLERAENLQKDFPRLPLSATDWHPTKAPTCGWLDARRKG